jgi:hypothetical protein
MCRPFTLLSAIWQDSYDDTGFHLASITFWGTHGIQSALFRQPPKDNEQKAFKQAFGTTEPMSLCPRLNG